MSSPDPFLTALTSTTLGLTKLPPHLPTFALSFLLFLFTHQVLSPWLSKRYAPVTYGALKGKKAKNTWQVPTVPHWLTVPILTPLLFRAIHIVSQLHVLIIVPASLWVLWNEDPRRKEDRVFGWSEDTGFVHAIACGYFLWDTWDAVWNFIDPGFVAHGLVCFAIFLMSFKPFVAYYGTRCLLWETSTFFLNIHWFMDKTGRTGSTAQLVNGGFLLISFFGVRIVYGGSVCYQFLQDLMQSHHELPLSYVLIYGTGNFLLQGLNWFWFYKMISALRKRFDDKDPSTTAYNPGNSIRADDSREPGERTRLADMVDGEEQDVHSDAEEGRLAARNTVQGKRDRAGSLAEYGTRQG